MDILPYVIASAAQSASVSTDLVLTTGVAQDSTDGWPALPGDLLMAFGGTGGAQPTGITTSRGDTFVKALGNSVSPALSAWSVVAGTNGLDATGPGFTADTVDVAYATNGQAKQWAIIGCQGLGAIDTAAQAQATGTSTAPSVTSGTPTASGDVVFAAVVYQNAGVSFNWGANWIPLASDITVGTNSLLSVAYRVNTGSGALTASGTLGVSAGWNAIILPVKKSLSIWNGVNPSNGRAIVGASVWKAAYPGEVTTDQQAKNRFDSIVGRKTANQGCKRYLNEGQFESQANQYQGVVSETLAGIQCLVSVKPTRVAGGGRAADIPLIRAMIIYWKNNGVAPHTCLWNEANLNGVNGPFGNATGSPYAPNATSTSCVTNYQQYFAFYAPTFIKAGLQCFFNSALPSPTTAISFIPPRKQADGRMLCTGVSVDFYMSDTSVNYPAGQPYSKTLANTITNCNGQSPKQNVGIGETGGTNGTVRPLTTNPSNFANWLHDMVVVPLAALMPTNQLLPIYWFANGTGNTIDTTTDPQVVTAYDAMYDALDPSGAGGGTLAITTASLPNGVIGQSYLVSLTATGGIPPYAWSIQTGSLTGSGLSLAGSGAISGTVAGSPATYSITWKVTDAASGTATVSLPIVTVSAFSFAGGTLPAANVGVSYSQNLAAFVTGGATPITYALDSTTQLPSGLGIATNGTLSGTPDQSSTGPPGSQPTAYSFNVIATDHNGVTASATFVMNVQSVAPTNFPPPILPPPVTAELYDGNLNSLMPINFTTLSAQLFYNAVGNWQMTMPYDDNVWQQVKSGTTIMVINWRGLFEFGGKIETPGYSSNVPGASSGAAGPGEQLFFSGGDYLAMIANRIAFPTPGSAWPSQTAAGKTTYTGPCETCIKNLISDNGGPTGQSGRRINIMDIVPTLGRGGTVTRDVAFVQGADLNLMDIIRLMIGTGGPMGVSLERNGQRLSFDCFVPRDLTQSVSFSETIGNMTSVAVSLTDPTCTIAFTQSSVTGSNFTSYSVASDQWGRTEVFVDQSGQTQIGNVSQAGNNALNQGAAQPSLVTAFTDIPSMTFGQDYWLGDNVTVEIRPGDVYQDLVSAVTLNVDPAQTPAISVVPQIGYSSDPNGLDPGYMAQLLNRVRKLERRLDAQRG